MFDAEKMMRLHGEAIGYVSYPPLEGQLRGVYERMAQSVNEEVEKQTAYIYGLLRAFVAYHDEGRNLDLEAMLDQARTILAERDKGDGTDKL